MTLIDDEITRTVSKEDVQFININCALGLFLVYDKTLYRRYGYGEYHKVRDLTPMEIMLDAVEVMGGIVGLPEKGKAVTFINHSGGREYV